MSDISATVIGLLLLTIDVNALKILRGPPFRSSVPLPSVVIFWNSYCTVPTHWCSPAREILGADAYTC